MKDAVDFLAQLNVPCLKLLLRTDWYSANFKKAAAQGKPLIHVNDMAVLGDIEEGYRRPEFRCEKHVIA